MHTGTHHALFLPTVDPSAFFKKEAAIAKMPDDDKKWPAHLLSELHKQLPFLSKLDVDIALDRVEPEAGYALGYASIANRTLRNSAIDAVGKPGNHLRIPLIIKERLLQPFHVFEVGGSVYPLTKERIEAAMVNPSVFDGVADKLPQSPSLVDQMNPPYQQRQGFGMIGAPGELSAVGKVASARIPMCVKIAESINKEDFARFDADFDSPARKLIEKSAMVLEHLQALVTARPKEASAMFSQAKKLASAQRLDVVQIRPEGYGYAVKFSSAPTNMAPQQVQMSAPQAQAAFPPAALQAADQQGVATMTSVQADIDPLQEQVNPIMGFGLYKVFERGTGKQIIGYVIPGLYDPQMGPTSQALFVNGGQYALQPQIVGSLIGLNFNLPENANVRGLGIFYKTDGKALFATVPFTIVSEVNVEGRKYYAAKAASGMDVQIVLSEGLRRPISTNPQEILIPADYKFMSLDNPIMLEGGDTDPMMVRQASAHGTCGEFRAWEGGCVLSGPVFSKLGSGEHDWADGLFYMAAAGIPQNVGLEILKKASAEGQALRLYGLHTLETVEQSVKEAAISAMVDLAGMTIPKRVNLLKEAAAISFQKEAGGMLADATSVDAVLSLNFINPENVSVFLESLPQLESAQAKLAGLVLATQLGLSSVPQNAAVRAMTSLEDTLSGLRALKNEV